MRTEITDEMLRCAATKAMLKLNKQLPDPEKCSHEFSPTFEKKIKKITQRISHPILYRVLQIAACFIVVFSLGFGSVLAVSAEAREAFSSWIKEVYETVYVYISTENRTSEKYEKEAYQPTWLPEGYTFDSQIVVSDGKINDYINEQGQLISFQSISKSEQSGLMVEINEGSEHQVAINGIMADVYIAENLGEDSVIIWEDHGTLLCISGNLLEEDLIQIAASVTVVDDLE